jgi:uncharacterized protein
MDIAAILQELTEPDGLPTAAIMAARERRDELIPVFCNLIEDWIAAPPAKRREPSPLFLAVHLLAEFRAKEGCRPVAALLACDGEHTRAQLGEALTETVPRIMLSVYDGDPTPLQAVIESPIAYDFVRSRMLETFAALTIRGDIDRPAAADYLRAVYDRLEPRNEHMVWDGWQMAIAALGLTDLVPLVRTAFDREWVPLWMSEYKDFTRDLKRARSDPSQPWEFPDDFAPFEDSLAEFSTWAAFSKDDERERRLRELADDEDDGDDWLPPGEPVVNPFRHVGRNDPCPCGSGKKFKKCCLGKVEAAGRDDLGEEA